MDPLLRSLQSAYDANPAGDGWDYRDGAKPMTPEQSADMQARLDADIRENNERRGIMPPIDDVKEHLRSMVCSSMPTTAIASGFVSPVDHSLTVANVLCDHPPARVAAYTGSENRSIGAVTKYLVAHGLPCSEGFAKLYRAELMKKAMRDAADAEHAAKTGFINDITGKPIANQQLNDFLEGK